MACNNGCVNLDTISAFVASTTFSHSRVFEMADAVQKRLTVTFKDVSVQVAGLGEDYGSTVASVVLDLIPSFKKSQILPRVRNKRKLELESLG